jgi:ribosomal protein L16 Arg81 hydroxylase
MTSPCTLADLVAPLDAATWRQEYLGRRPVLLRGAAERFAPLLSWGTLDGLIRDLRPSGPRFRLTRSNQTLPEAAYHRVVETLRGPLRQLEPARLMAELRGGATLIWDSLDQHHAPLRPLKRMLERELQGQVWANLYASWGTTSGVAPHWDDHDVFVIQVLGRKHWRLHAPTRPWPLPDELEQAPPPAALDRVQVLEAGDVLYLPRGWWHLVTPLDEPSLHLTFGVLRPTNADFLRWLVQRASALELVRQDLPLALDPARHAAELRGALAELLQPSLLEEYLREREARAPGEPRPTLEAVGQPDAARWNPEARAVLLASRARLDGATLVAAGQRVPLPREALGVAGALVEGREVTVGALVAALSAPAVSELVGAGLLAVL